MKQNATKQPAQTTGNEVTPGESVSSKRARKHHRNSNNVVQSTPVNVVKSWSNGMCLTKEQKRFSSTILDAHDRGAFKRACLDANQTVIDNVKKKIRTED